ncbi:hypothetical protein SAMN05660479_00820 [Microbulbifer thermotolerans]|nr:hypothetical protein SAMN05660479_00820 [Microbulbifer thermotolerans]
MQSIAIRWMRRFEGRVIGIKLPKFIDNLLFYKGFIENQVTEW